MIGSFFVQQTYFLDVSAESTRLLKFLEPKGKGLEGYFSFFLLDLFSSLLIRSLTFLIE